MEILKERRTKTSVSLGNPICNYLHDFNCYLLPTALGTRAIITNRAIEMMNTVKNRTPKGKKIPNC